MKFRTASIYSKTKSNNFLPNFNSKYGTFVPTTTVNISVRYFNIQTGQETGQETEDERQETRDVRQETRD